MRLSGMRRSRSPSGTQPVSAMKSAIASAGPCISSRSPDFSFNVRSRDRGGCSLARDGQQVQPVAGAQPQIARRPPDEGRAWQHGQFAQDNVLVALRERPRPLLRRRFLGVARVLSLAFARPPRLRFVIFLEEGPCSSSLMLKTDSASASASTSASSTRMSPARMRLPPWGAVMRTSLRTSPTIWAPLSSISLEAAQGQATALLPSGTRTSVR
jgi:hypothetical protein